MKNRSFSNSARGAYAEPVENETDLDDNTLGDGWVVVTIPEDINADNPRGTLWRTLGMREFCAKVYGSGLQPGQMEI